MTWRAQPCSVYPRNVTLRVRVLLVLLVVGLLAGGVTGVLLTNALREVARQAGEAELLEEAGDEIARIRAEVRRMESDVRFLAQTPPIGGIARARAHDGVDPRDGSTEAVWRERLAMIFTEMLETRPEYVQIRLIGFADGGREIVRVDHSAQGVVVVDALQQKGREPYFNEVFQVRDGGVYASEITLNREHGAIQEPPWAALRLGTPVRIDGDPFAFVIVNVDARDMLHPAGEHELVVTDGVGRALFHPEPGVAFRHEYTPGVLPEDVRPVLRTLRGESTGQTVVHEGVLSVARHLPYGAPPFERRIGVIARSPVARLTEAAPAALRGLAASFFVLVLVALGLAVWLSRYASRPVMELTEAVRILEQEGRPWKRPDGLDRETTALAEALEQAFERLRERRRELQRANHDLATYTQVAAHQLQEPARRLAMFGELLRTHHGGALGSDAEVLLRELEEGARQLQEQLAGLIRYSELVGAEPVILTDLGPVVRDVLRRLEPRAVTLGATIEVAELPSLRCGSRHLQVVFEELIENALQAARPGEAPQVRIEGERVDGVVHLRVIDQGIGIPAAERERVFELFTQVGERPGRGLGLATVRRIADLHCGTVRIAESPPSGRTTVELTLRDRRKATRPSLA